ncbi:hypothetical protein D3C75_1097330 [compost metagenome]
MLHRADPQAAADFEITVRFYLLYRETSAQPHPAVSCKCHGCYRAIDPAYSLQADMIIGPACCPSYPSNQ